MTRTLQFLSILLLVFCNLILSCKEKEPPAEIQKYLGEYYINCDDSAFAVLFKDFKTDNYIPIIIIHDGDTIKDAQMRLRGDTSREYPKKSLKIKLPTITFKDHTDVINFNSEYTDKSYIRQFMSSLLMRKAGINCYKSELVKIYLNNKFFGIYLKVENVDDNFLTDRNLSTTNNLYKAKKDGACLSIYDDVQKVWEKKTNKKSDWNDLLQLIEKVNQTPAEKYYEFVKENFNYDQFINLLAMNMLLANGSTWYHNYYLYHDLNTDKWEIFPWDMDKTLSYYSWAPYAYNKTSSNWESDNPLIEKSLMNEQIFKDLTDKIDELHSSIVNSDYTEPIIDQLYSLLENVVPNDATDKVPDLSTWKNAVKGERTFFKEQYKALQFSFKNWPRNFEVIPTAKTEVMAPVIRWYPSKIMNGKTLTYRLYYSTNFLLEEDTTTLKVIDNIKDTFACLPNNMTAGKYFWKVIATDGKYSTEAFNTKNFFEYKPATDLSENIRSNLVLDESKSPYIIRKDITVEQNATLTINPGVEVYFLDTVTLWVTGQIKVRGTKDKPVVLKCANESSYWGSVYINNPNGNSSFEYTVFDEGVLRSKHSTLSVSNCTFNINRKKLHYSQERRECIVWIHKGKFNFNNNIVNGNGQGEGMDINYAIAKVENSKFYNTPDAIEYINVPDGLIKGNYVADSPDDAIDMNGSTNITVTGNILINNKDKGISIGTEQYGPSRNIMVDHNLIIGCNYGIAVKDSSQANIRNNTLFKNNTGIACYLKKPGQTVGGEVAVENTIIESSTKNDVSCDKASKLKVHYSCSNTSKIEGQGNIKADADFINPENMNFYLNTESPCLSGGKDKVYIGAYSPAKSLLIINGLNYSSAKNFEEGDWIRIYNPNFFTIDITGWTISNSKDHHKISQKTQISAFETIYLVSSHKKFRIVHPSKQLHTLSIGISFGKKKGTGIQLIDNKGNLIDVVEFGNENFPKDKKDKNCALILTNNQKDNNIGANWSLICDHDIEK